MQSVHAQDFFFLLGYNSISGLYSPGARVPFSSRVASATVTPSGLKPQR